MSCQDELNRNQISIGQIYDRLLGESIILLLVGGVTVDLHHALGHKMAQDTKAVGDIALRCGSLLKDTYLIDKGSERCTNI